MGLKILLALLAIPLIGVLVGQLGWLQGTAPTDLGVKDGRLAPPKTSPNSVSSQAALWSDRPGAARARIEPLPMQGDPIATMARLKALIEATPGARIVREEPGYLYVQYTTRWLRFVDDAEFWADPSAGVVHLRSASRLGESDLGVNRARIEALRAQWLPR